MQNPVRPATTPATTLARQLWPEETANRMLRATLLCLIGSALIAASAQVRVPLWPVPMTMQTFAVLALGLAYGPRLGTATVLVYLAEGAMGLPVFAGFKAGPAALMGPTAGYLVGFALAAALVGRLGERGWDRRALTTVAAMLLGNLAIYAAGAGWLATLVGPTKALELGVLPFLPGDALKIALAATILPLLRRTADRRRT